MSWGGKQYMNVGTYVNVAGRHLSQTSKTSGDTQ